MIRLRLLLPAFLLVLLPVTARAEPGFDQWVQDFRVEMAGQVSARTLNAALGQAEFLPRVIELDRKQPEGTITFAQYRSNILSEQRISKGRDMFARHRTLLERIGREYGVQPQYIVALWGIETNYGGNSGKTEIISALATLAYEGRRHEFFKDELVKALRILDEGHISVADMKGSWAGAMGQCQFMPSSFLNFAVDGDGDGKRDIWTNVADVFASAANYLAESGWKEGQAWGREVRLPATAASDWVGLETERPLSEWARLGVLQANGQPLPNDPFMSASLVQPDGASGPSYLVYDNYRVIRKWNRSTYFATTVGLLADQIRN